MGNFETKEYKMVAIFVWAVVILWCTAALFLVSLPFVFAIMHLLGKGNLAKSWWLKIKPRFKRSAGTGFIRHGTDASRISSDDDWYRRHSPMYSSSLTNIYHK